MLGKKTKALIFLASFVLLLPCVAFGQIAVPSWVDDIGGPGSSSSIPATVRADKQNNIYITGIYSGTVDFDPSAGVYNLTSVAGSYDTYLAKYTPAGKLVWAVGFGGDGTDQVNGLTIDDNGNPTVIGQYDSSSMDVDPGPGVFTLNNNGDKDGFIVHFDTDGNFKWAKSIGSNQTDYGDKVTADHLGNVIAVLQYEGSVNVDGKSFTSNGSFNGLIVKYDVSGTLVWAIDLSDTADNEVRFVSADVSNNIVVSGAFANNVNFNPLGATHTLNGNGNSTFLAKYAPSGNLIWVQPVRGGVVNNNSNLCINSKGDIYLDGPFSSTLVFNTTSINPISSQDIFIAKYDQNGAFQEVKDIGGAGSTIYNYGLVTSSADDIYVSGYFSGTIDFDPSNTSAALVSDHGQRDLFFAKYDSEINYKWAFSAGNGGCNMTLGRSIDVDSNDDVLLTGSFCSTVNFDASKCTSYNLTAQSDTRDSFLAKYVQSKATAISQITAFSVPPQDAPAIIDQKKLQITITVPTGTDVTALSPSITVSSGVTLTPASGTAQNFSSPVTYTLTTACSSLNYTVNVVFDSGIITTPPSGPTVCATSGADGPTNISGSINSYFPASGNVTLAAGAQSVALGSVPATDAHGNNFGSVPITAGDLLLIIQMQDATIDFSNSTLYGANNATSGLDGLGATGYTNLGNSGKFEYVIATNNVPLTGGTLTFKGSGTGNGTVYSYTNAGPTATSGQKSFQIIRIPQYSNLRLSSNISPPPFNGAAGGVIAFEVSGNMDFNGFTVDVSGRGFRGGYSLVKNSVSNISDLYVAPANDQRVSGKGEGIAGTPRYMWDGYNQVDNVVEGLPGGSGGRGAPANAGGGGNDSNSGGAGGGNGGQGGVGGLGYQPIGGSTAPNGGRPGINLPSDYTRLIMGGGGGGGHANDALTGVKGGVGGGIVVINARSISGNGTINANGSDGQPGAYGQNPDGSGGGGAGGSVFVKVSNPVASASLTINANGGLGGNTQHDTGAVQPHGPGGGGGGGSVFYAIAAGTVNVNVNGGASGKTNSGQGTSHFAGDGNPGIQQTITVAKLPPYLQGSGSSCLPQLDTKMRIKTPGVPVKPGDTAAYLVTIVNKSAGGNAGGVQADVLFQPGFSFKDATVAYAGNSNGPAALANKGTSTEPLLGDFNIPAGDSITVTVTVTVGCITSGTYNSSAEALYLDPTRDYTAPNRLITAKTNAFAGTNTTYQVGGGNVPGSNFNGSASTAENVVVNNTAVTNNKISLPAASQSYCGSGNPPAITGSLPVSSGSFTYQWQSSADSVNFTDIAGATSKDYDPPLLQATIYYRRDVTAAVCPAPNNSNIIKITIAHALSNNSITAPAVTSFCASGDPVIITGSAPAGGDSTYTYQWQQSINGGGTFTDIAGATNADYDPPVLSTTTIYQRVVTTGICTTPLVSNKVTITVLKAITSNNIFPPATTSYCSQGGPAIINGNIPSGGTGTFIYQWQSSPDGAIYTDIPGATKNDYNMPVITTTTYYRRLATSGACSTASVSSVVIITIQPGLGNNSIIAPAVVSFCGPGNPAVIQGSAATGGNGVYSYQWQSSPDGGAFTDIPGATNQNYDPPLLNATTYYQRVVTSGSCTTPLVSNQVSITIQPALAGNIITAPAITSFCGSGDPAVISGGIPTGGNGIYAFQWQSSSDNITFTDIPRATAQDFDPPAVSADTWYRRTATSAGCAAPLISNVVKISVTPAVANNIITAPAVNSFCTSGNPAVITGSTPTGGTGAYAYQWQSSTDNVTFTDIPGATTKNYDPATLNITTWYRRTVTSGVCSIPIISNVVEITITPAVANNIITAPAVTGFCASGDPSPITGSTPTGGDGTFTYQWQSSTDNISFTDIAGATAKDFDPPSLTANTWYRRTVTSGFCITPVVSNVVEITVTPQIANNVITAPAVTGFCSSGDPALITGSTPTGGTGAYIYQWQSSADNITFSDITGATAKTYDPPSISITTWYRRTVTSGICNIPLISNVVNIIITPSPPTPVPVAANVAVCSGGAATVSVASPQPGITYDWYDSATKTNHLFTGSTYTTGPLSVGETYYVGATNGSCGSPSLASVTVTVNGILAAPVVINNPAATCNGSAVTLSISNPLAGYTYNWYSAAAGGTALFSGTDFTTPVLSSDIIYYAEAVNSSGCVSTSRTAVNVTVNAIPQITVQDAGVCPGSTATLTASSTDNNAVINWYSAPTGGSIIFTGGSFTTPALSTSTTYYAEAADNTTGCTATRTAVTAQILTALAAPVVTVDSTTISSVTFQWTAVPGATGYQVSLDNGQTFVAPSSGSNGLIEKISGLQPEESVTVIVRAVGSLPCQLSTSSTAVTGKAVNPAGDLIYVPNAFTPNGDGKNDAVHVHSENIKSLKFYVYDQWGELIYTSTSLQNGWDGTYKGTKEPVGVYVYYLEAIMIDGHSVNKKGTITLLR